MAAPIIRLDPAGTISGRITDPSGAPVSSGHVGLVSPGANGSNEGVDLDADGRYTYGGVGPYEWPLHISSDHFAWQFSGGTPNRHDAVKIKVTAGATTTYNASMTAGVTMSGTFRTRDGRPVEAGHLMARNSVTGDIVGLTWMRNGQYSMRLLGNQHVWLEYRADIDGKFYYGRVDEPTMQPPPRRRTSVGLLESVDGTAPAQLRSSDRRIGPYGTTVSTVTEPYGTTTTVTGALTAPPRRTPPGLILIPASGSLTKDIVINIS